MWSAQPASPSSPLDGAIPGACTAPVASQTLPPHGGPSRPQGQNQPPDSMHACQTHPSHLHHFSEAESDLVLRLRLNRKRTHMAKCWSSYFRVLVNKRTFSKTKPSLVTLPVSPEERGDIDCLSLGTSSCLAICLEPKGCLDTFSDEHTEVQE